MTIAKTRHLLALAILVTVSAVTMTGARAACPEIMQDFQRASARQDTEALTDLYRRAETFASGCSGRELAVIGDHLALSFGLQAAQAMRFSAPQQEVERLLALGFRYGRPWKLLALAGDYYKSIKDYEQAAHRYQEALNGLDDLRNNWSANDQKAFTTLYRRATQMRGLAQQHVAAPRTRSGEPGGVWLGLRDLVVSSVPVPVQFRYNSAELTEIGRQYADELLTFLTSQDLSEAVLVGHTDPKGEACYNLRLSRQRAEALSRYLKEGGYRGTIRVIPRGEADPISFQADEGFTEAEQYQLMRRVELWMNGAPPPAASCR